VTRAGLSANEIRRWVNFIVSNQSRHRTPNSRWRQPAGYTTGCRCGVVAAAGRRTSRRCKPAQRTRVATTLIELDAQPDNPSVTELSPVRAPTDGLTPAEIVRYINITDENPSIDFIALSSAPCHVGQFPPSCTGRMTRRTVTA